MEREERSSVITVIMIGVMVGVVTCVFGFVVTGAGHGLFTALFTFSSVVLAPTAFVAVLRRRRRSAKLAVLAIAAVGIGVDVAICVEGIHNQMFEKVWNAVPASFALWITAWLSWQFVLLLKAAHE
jgi:hypothetical protein